MICHGLFIQCRSLSFYFPENFRKYEAIATLGNRNFDKVLEIAANANRCTRSGSTVSQYTFKKSTSEDEVLHKLCQILDGSAATVTL